MTAAGTPVTFGPQERESRSLRANGAGGLLYGSLAALVASAWWFSRLRLFDPAGDTNYWLGVVGGSMMAMLFLYPLRKRIGVMARWGRLRDWFVVHMVLGIAGPWLILVHSSFRAESLNAAVALYSMCIVVCSGVIGRFIYMRVHRGLAGERISFRELQQRAGLVESEARSWLRFAPDIEAALVAFEQRELSAAPGWATWMRQVLLLPLARWREQRRCTRELNFVLRRLAREERWSADTLRARMRRSQRLVARYLNAVVRVAQHKAYERLFALWHVAHVPVLFLLVLSAVVHVIAVHAY